MKRAIIFDGNVSGGEVFTKEERIYIEEILKYKSESDLKEGFLNIGEVTFTASFNSRGDIEVNKVNLL